MDDRSTTSSETVDSTGQTAGLLDDDSIVDIDHVAIAVNDLESAIEWYTHNFPFRVVDRRLTRGERTAMVSAVLQAGRAVVVLIQGTTSDSQVSQFIQRFGCGVQHIALQVKDLDAAIQRLRGQDSALATPTIADTGIKQAFLRRDEKSGVRIELIERRGGEFTDESVERLFRAFEARGLY